LSNNKSKFQITISKSQTNYKFQFQNSKQDILVEYFGLGHRPLDIVWYLVLGYWNLKNYFRALVAGKMSKQNMRIRPKQRNIMTPSRKTFQNTVGKWIEKKTRTEILLCVCGAKYIKTRKEQSVCIRCIYRTLPIKTL